MRNVFKIYVGRLPIDVIGIVSQSKPRAFVDIGQALLIYEHIRAVHMYAWKNVLFKDCIVAYYRWKRIIYETHSKEKSELRYSRVVEHI